MPDVVATSPKKILRPDAGIDALQFVFTVDDFSRIKDLIYRAAGISLSPAKKDLVYSRLARRLRVLRISSFSDYIGILESGERKEWEEFINALTTNMTSFFREPHHFPILSRHIAHVSRRSLNIWSAASSTGEEPYSIAMTMVEHYGRFDIPVKIIATDIDTNVLEKARQGIYPLDQLRKLSTERLRRFFLRGDNENEGLARVKPELRKLVSFMQINLLDEQWPLQERFDAIFCRNVMIYFDKPTQYSVLKKMSRNLQPDGLLFAGHSESFQHAADLFRPTGKTVYTLAASDEATLHHTKDIRHHVKNNRQIKS